MSRYIDANKLEESIRKLRRCMQLMDNSKRADIVMQGISLAEIEIEKIPSADVREVVHGEWIDYSENGYVECPICHSLTTCDDNIKELHFCFSCGAELRGGTE